MMGKETQAVRYLIVLKHLCWREDLEEIMVYFKIVDCEAKNENTIIKSVVKSYHVHGVIG